MNAFYNKLVNDISAMAMYKLANQETRPTLEGADFIAKSIYDEYAPRFKVVSNAIDAMMPTSSEETSNVTIIDPRTGQRSSHTYTPGQKPTEHRGSDRFQPAASDKATDFHKGMPRKFPASDIHPVMSTVTDMNGKVDPLITAKMSDGTWVNMHYPDYKIDVTGDESYSNSKYY